MKTIRNLAGVMALMAFAAVSTAKAATAPFVEKDVPGKEPYLSTKGDRVFLNYLNVDMDDVSIKVIDNSGRILYRETIEDELVIEKSFNFEQAYGGEYRVVVEHNGEKFIKKIRV